MVRRSGVFIVNFEHISHLVLVFLLLTLSKLMPAGNVTEAPTQMKSFETNHQRMQIFHKKDSRSKGHNKSKFNSISPVVKTNEKIFFHGDM